MEINPIAVASHFLQLAKDNFLQFPEDEPNETERLFASKLFKNYLDILTENVVEDDYVLEEDPTSQGSLWSQSSTFDEDGNEIPEKTDLSLDKKIWNLKEVEAHPNWNESTIHRRISKDFKFQYVKRWKDQIRRGGTQYEKYHFIETFTHDAFLEARKSLLTVRDSNLREWALQAAQTIIDEDFKFTACSGWIFNFKKKHGITSRKITRLVSRHEHQNKEDVMAAAKNFQIEFREASKTFDPMYVLNTDQVGFTYEIVGNRTLSHKGEKLTMGIAKSPKNLVTHSYTIQYVINKLGQIVGNVFLCLQETSGRLGVKVQEGLFPAANVTITCSKSGKLTTSLYEYFLDEVIVPTVTQDFLFLIDSWSGQTCEDIYLKRFGNGSPNCTIKIIPKNCTPYCQPLDTTFNRQLKVFARKICDEAAKLSSAGLHKDDEVTKRNNIIRMHSLLHNQLSAPVFQPMIKYAWFSSGLSDEKPLFDSVTEACFTFQKDDTIICELNCNRCRFLKCAHCRKILCFDCFFYQYHLHPDNQ